MGLPASSRGGGCGAAGNLLAVNSLIALAVGLGLIWLGARILPAGPSDRSKSPGQVRAGSFTVNAESR